MVEGEFRPVRPDARPAAQIAAIAGNFQRPARLKGAALAGFDAPAAWPAFTRCKERCVVPAGRRLPDSLSVCHGGWQACYNHARS